MDRNKTRTNQPSNGLNPFTYDNAFAHGTIKKKVDNQRDFSEIIFIILIFKVCASVASIVVHFARLACKKKRIFLRKFFDHGTNL